MKFQFAFLCWASFLGGACADQVTLPLEDDLKQFHLPGIELNERRLKEVLKGLEKSYHEASKEISEVESALAIEGDRAGELTLTGRIPAQSIWASLHQIGGQAGCTVSFQQDRVVLNRIPGNGNRGEFQFPVHSSFFIDQLSERSGAGLLSKETFQNQDQAARSETLRKVFVELGLFVDQESRASFDPKESRLVITATGEEKQRVETFLKSLTEGPKSIRVTVRVVSGPAGLALRPGELAPLEVQTVFRAASQTRGTQFLTLPSVVMNSGDKTFLDLDQGELKGKLREDFVKIDLDLELLGRGIRGKVCLWRELPKAGGREGKLQDFRHDVALRDRDTLIVKMNETEERVGYLAVTAEVIDPTGRRVREVGQQVPAK